MIKDRQLDHEWVELILEALETGISVEEIREFFIKTGNPAV
ncbi:anti-repressor SinI family protein [Metabacillus endolithicus]|nr:anti-repressor SinI family protein [Metabacillus endolithicus]UPG65832.1 anti-repressor SinI family protein [Metabacillus endolithicus]